MWSAKKTHRCVHRKVGVALGCSCTSNGKWVFLSLPKKNPPRKKKKKTAKKKTEKKNRKKTKTKSKTEKKKRKKKQTQNREKNRQKEQKQNVKRGYLLIIPPIPKFDSLSLMG
jgi:hypothetical protein